jgi:hypothetical protein
MQNISNIFVLVKIPSNQQDGFINNLSALNSVTSGDNLVRELKMLFLKSKNIIAIIFKWDKLLRFLQKILTEN